MRVTDERLRQHADFANRFGKRSWNALRCLTLEEQYDAITDLLALRAAARELLELTNPLDITLPHCTQQARIKLSVLVDER